MGSMLAEVLPFLRGIASAIQQKLGEGHPGILPTTMATYAMTSLLLGVVFLVLAALRCGDLVGYFPQTVMTGVIGANTSYITGEQADDNRCCRRLTLSLRAGGHASYIVASSQP